MTTRTTKPSPIDVLVPNGEPRLLTKTLADHALQAMREEVLSGRWPAGARIQLEETAAWLGVSPSPVREALRTLGSEGLVTPLPQRGFRVAEVSESDLEDTYRLRMVLDPMAVRLAVPRLTQADFLRLDATIEELREVYAHDDHERIEQVHREFHFGIYGAANSQWLSRFLSMLWSNSVRYQHLSVSMRGTPAARAEAHRRILEAARAGDVERAASLVEQHLATTHQTVTSILAKKRQFGGEAAT